jgi:multicomponent Na+:H+ antiporter subunit E
MAYVILHPSLPIDPSVVEYEGAVWGSLPSTTLANSITLTPGTLTIEVVESHFYVHALIPSARDGLLGGALERAVRFVFYGRSAMRIPTPEERREQRGDEE